MSWTAERLEILRRMWLEGHTASQIADELGGVSRNAVIGKAHRLGFGPRSLMTPAMLSRINALPLSKRTQRALATENYLYVGDLVAFTEAELLRIPDLGRKALGEVKAALATLDLRLGMWVANWPPENVENLEKQWETARRVSELRQAPGGATFQPADDHFTMATEGDENDLAAAVRPMTQQMHSALLQKARNFSDVAVRLDNQAGWNGIGRTASSLAELLDRPTMEIPDVLGLLYPAALELGSFIELNQQLTSAVDSYVVPLEPELGRSLSDLVRNLAPWLRSFPSVREADDEASKFLVQAAELKPTVDVVRAAADYELLTAADLEVFRQLNAAALRGAFQGEKAGGRAKRLTCSPKFLHS